MEFKEELNEGAWGRDKADPASSSQELVVCYGTWETA